MTHRSEFGYKYKHNPRSPARAARYKDRRRLLSWWHPPRRCRRKPSNSNNNHNRNDIRTRTSNNNNNSKLIGCARRTQLFQNPRYSRQHIDNLHTMLLCAITSNFKYCYHLWFRITKISCWTIRIFCWPFPDNQESPGADLVCCAFRLDLLLRLPYTHITSHH